VMRRALPRECLDDLVAVHAAEGLLITLMLRMRRRSWASTTNTYNT
jgi:hypothetical protein